MNSLDVMIDLETTGTKAGCGILSIGACTFDGNHKFYDRIHHSSSIELGLVDDPDTLAWWARQNPEARMEAFSGETHILNALGKFSDWFKRLPADNKNVFIWGNGADFDQPILQAAFVKAGMKAPWAPFNSRCYRTLKNLYFGVKAPAFQGIKHNALADAMHQASHAREILSIHFSKAD